MSGYQEVQNLTISQGIGSVRQDGDETVGVCQFYGGNEYCEQGYDGDCGDDGILWGDPDGNVAVFCTNHFFPQEQLGYEFYLTPEYCDHPDANDYFNKCFDCGAEYLAPEGGTWDELTEELSAWTTKQGLPLMSADDLMVERGSNGELLTTKLQRDWLYNFIAIWEEVEE